MEVKVSPQVKSLIVHIRGLQENYIRLEKIQSTPSDVVWLRWIKESITYHRGVLGTIVVEEFPETKRGKKDDYWWSDSRLLGDKPTKMFPEGKTTEDQWNKYR